MLRLLSELKGGDGRRSAGRGAGGGLAWWSGEGGRNLSKRLEVVGELTERVPPDAHFFGLRTGGLAC